MYACYVHGHDYCRSSATDINQQDRPWGLLMAAKIPFWFSRDITLHVTDSLFANNESIHSHFVIFECQWTSIQKESKRLLINFSATHKIHKASERTTCFLSWECKRGYHTIIAFAGPFQTTTPETGSVVTQGTSAETHSQNEQQDGAGEVRETKLSKLLMISYYITSFYSWHGAAWAGVWRQTKVALNFSKGTDF